MRRATLSILFLTGCNLFTPVGEPDTGGEPLPDVAEDLAQMPDVADASQPDDAARDMQRSDTTDGGVEDAPIDGFPDLGPVLGNPTMAYDFETVREGIVPDVSGGEPYHLTINGTITVENGAATIQSGALQTTDTLDEFYTGVDQSGEFAFSVWLETASLNQGVPDDSSDVRRVVTISENTGSRNATFAQWRSNGILRVRSVNTSLNGLPQSQVDGAFELGVHHHLFQFRDGSIEYYVDGELADTALDTSLDGWNAGYGLSVGDEFGGDRQWQGTVHDLRIYTVALAPDDVRRLYSAGVP